MAKTTGLFSSEVFGKRNFDALDDVYTSDACILPPGSPMISGRQAIKNFWSNLVVSANALSAVLSTIEIIPASDGAVEVGTARLTVQPAGQPSAELEIKYVVYWRQENGHWKWHIDIWNQNS